MTALRNFTTLDEIMEKAKNRIPLNKDEICFVLNLTAEQEINKVFETARYLREKFFENKIFLYGFVYFSTYCRNDCAFCFYRKSNNSAIRYRKNEEEIISTAEKLAESGVHLLDLTMGEDPKYFADNYDKFHYLLEVIQILKKKTALPIMISPGVVSKKILQDFKDVGVDWYACYQETHNEDLYKKMRLNQDYNERLQTKVNAKKSGLLIEEGILTGIGDTAGDIANSLNMMGELQANQIRVMTFVPQKGTPLDHWPQPGHLRELLTIAAMRLVFPDKLIPASLDVDGIKGLKARLAAGANVVTSIIPPMSGLAGVSQSSLDINEGYRTVQGVQPILEGLGLSAADKADYANWVMEHNQK